MRVRFLLSFLALVVATALGVVYFHIDKLSLPSLNDTAPLVNSSMSIVEQCSLVRVIDGDTLLVDLSGVSEYVRLIGIDAPESVHDDETKNTAEGLEASYFLKSYLTEGQSLYLTKDVSDRDKYERLLRYVWIVEPDTSEDISIDMVNAYLVACGYAQPKQYQPDTAYAPLFEELGAKACDGGLGVSYVWSV